MPTAGRNLPAIIGMVLSALCGAAVLIVLITAKNVAGVLDLVDGIDHQNHLAWFAFIAAALVPVIIYFLAYRRLNTRPSRADPAPDSETGLYWLIAIGSLAFLAVRAVQTGIVGVPLVLAVFPVLLILAIRQSQKP